MSRPMHATIFSRILRAVDRAIPPSIVEAHCDIPCGIYDPHLAQIGALTVIRMNQLIENLQAGSNDKSDTDKYGNSFARYIATKEEHAELVKREVRIIWGDYFKPEHAEKFPELHQLTWDIMKLASKARQEVNMQAAQDLLGKLQRYAEIFWETKGVASKKQSSNQAVGGELVVPAN